VWEGYGWLNDNSSSTVEFRPIGEVPAPPPSLRTAVLDGPRVHLPSRDYLLFEGPLGAATELGCRLPGGVFFPQSPNLFWPNDRAWCVASEIDLFCTLVGGSNALVDSLIANPHLEAWRVFPDESVTADSDAINR
jgi:hypothetical protein